MLHYFSSYYCSLSEWYILTFILFSKDKNNLGLHWDGREEKKTKKIFENWWSAVTLYLCFWMNEIFWRLPLTMGWKTARKIINNQNPPFLQGSIRTTIKLYIFYWYYTTYTIEYILKAPKEKMSAAAGIGALSISTIEGTYRGNEKTNLYIFIDYYIILYFCQKKQWKHQVLIYKSLILRNPFDRWPITSWLHKEKKTVERYIQLPTYPLPHHQHL